MWGVMPLYLWAMKGVPPLDILAHRIIWCSVVLALAATGVAYLIIARGELPWIALVLAATFGLYGLVRKMTPVDAVVGLSVEAFLLVPAAGACLVTWAAAGSGAFGQRGATIDLL